MADLDVFLTEAPGKSLYALLGVAHTSTIAELKKAYRRLCLWCHPDKTTPAADRSCSSARPSSCGRSYEAQGLRRVATAHHTQAGLRQAAVPTVPRRRLLRTGRGARWTEEQWRDAGVAYDQRTAPSEPRVQPRSLTKAAAAPRRRYGQKAVARKGRGRSRTEGAMEREAQVRREEAGGVDGRAPTRRARARRRAAAATAKSAEARKKCRGVCEDRRAAGVRAAAREDEGRERGYLEVHHARPRGARE